MYYQDTKILIIEDKTSHYRTLYENLKETHECYPPVNGQKDFIERIIAHFKKKSSSNQKLPLPEDLKKELSMDFDCIVLDISLESKGKDFLGLELINIFRQEIKNKFTPILILSTYEFSKIEKAFTHYHIANYYIQKPQSIETNKNISEDDSALFLTMFFSVVNMLCIWNKRMKNLRSINIDTEHAWDIIQTTERIENNTQTIIEDLNYIKNLNKIAVNILRSQNIDDKKASKYADDLIVEYGLNDLNAFKYKKDKLIDRLSNIKKVIVDALKNDLKENLIDVIKDELKDYLDIDEQESLEIEIIKKVSLFAIQKFV